MTTPIFQDPGGQGLKQNIRYTTRPQAHYNAKRIYFVLFTDSEDSRSQEKFTGRTDRQTDGRTPDTGRSHKLDWSLASRAKNGEGMLHITSGNMTWELVLCAFFTIVVVKFLRDSWFKKTIPLDGKVIFITGCDTGFGNALARKLDSLGCVVFAGCLSSSGKGAKVLQEETSPRLKVLDLDTSDDKSVEKARDFVKNYLSSSDSELWALVNNAGIMVKAQIEICSMEIFHKIAEVNLFGTIRVTKAFLPFVRHAKGRVVNMSSVHGRYSSPTYACYGLSKHGIENFSDVLRMEMSGFGVKVSIIEPGRFGAATGIFSGDALATRLTALDDMWSKADEEIKTVYKSRYEELRRQQSAKPSSNTSSQSMEPVLNAMVDAIENVSPKHRYLLGGNAFDDHCASHDDLNQHDYLSTAIDEERCSVVSNVTSVILVDHQRSGFGNALARKLDQLGCTVFAGCFLSSENCAKTLKEETSSRLKVIDLDISNDKSVEKARDSVKNYLNSSGSGRVINVSSVHGRYGMPTMSSYAISKHGVENFSDILRMEMRRFGVKVSIIEPGRFGAATGISSGIAVGILFFHCIRNIPEAH
ncbi:hypothetical protein FSP39_018727 [Pinctada imbricata]|uniref:D-beta-hydroxybutyrate dehydrogenase, mitochondrial n=1 Tax=Pinctada imbricata TaxID=66713 RepID=A0AA88XZV0_PINIB|nr:hypothetical protein FSP39_018727 [Pinctada imbricata]